MNNFLSQILLLIFLVGTFPANAYTCHENDNESTDNTNQQVAVDCHQMKSDNKNEIENNIDEDCCDSDCTVCFHTNIYVMNSIFQSIGYIDSKTSYYAINLTNFFPDISTPPPNV